MNALTLCFEDSQLDRSSPNFVGFSRNSVIAPESYDILPVRLEEGKLDHPFRCYAGPCNEDMRSIPSDVVQATMSTSLERVFKLEKEMEEAREKLRVLDHYNDDLLLKLDSALKDGRWLRAMMMEKGIQLDPGNLPAIVPSFDQDLTTKNEKGEERLGRDQPHLSGATGNVQYFGASFPFL